jgi:hypothetical protein
LVHTGRASAGCVRNRHGCEDCERDPVKAAERERSLGDECALHARREAEHEPGVDALPEQHLQHQKSARSRAERDPEMRERTGAQERGESGAEAEPQGGGASANRVGVQRSGEGNRPRDEQDDAAAKDERRHRRFLHDCCPERP